MSQSGKMTKYKWTINLTIAAPMILICSVIIAGGGHGFADQLFILFPWTYISKFIDSQILFILIGLIQFPIYGLLYDQSVQKNKTVFTITIIHFLLAIVILFLKYK